MFSSNKMALLSSLALTTLGVGLNAGAFYVTTSLFSDHGEAERKRHDLAMEDFQKARDEWNKGKTKKTGFHQ